jgi:uncharacterized cofD-like protein
MIQKDMVMNKKPHKNRIWEWIVSRIRWLSPGLGIKRWIFIVLIGTMMLGLGFAVLALDIYRTAPDTWWLPVLSFLSLRFLDRTLRAVIFGGIGLVLFGWGIWGLNRSLLKPFIRPGKPVLDTVTAYRKQERGPRVVVIGGGTGLSALLRGIKTYTKNITAIVTVADDGGSSGELRRSIGILPPGDIRNCLAALSDDEAMLTQIFQYRFSEGAGLNGHTLGNLLITALTEITGSFEEAIAESGQVLAVKGKVLPSTLHDVRLVADVSLPHRVGEVKVKGESLIPKIAGQTGQVERVWLEPNNPSAFPPALQAILAADLIIIGPGSLYTSILPNLLVPDIAAAIRTSRALKFYVCNVTSQRGETDGFTCDDHVDTLNKHLGSRMFDLIICNNRYDGELPEGIDWIKPGPAFDEKYSVYYSALASGQKIWQHDSEKLAETVMDLFYERTGPLGSKDYF